MRESVQQTESKIAALDLIKAQVLDELAVIKDKEEDAWKVLEGLGHIIVKSYAVEVSDSYNHRHIEKKMIFFKVFLNSFFENIF